MLAFLLYILFYVLALLATVLLFFCAASVGSFFVKLTSTINYTFLRRKFSVYGYQWFYTTRESIENDEKCLRLYPILKELYVKGSSFSEYCPRLSEDRMPLNVIMNWARSVSEDLFLAPVPSVKLDQWNHYWKSKLYARVSFFHTEFPKYEEHEMGCIWGMVFLWLAANFDKDLEDPLMKRIMQLGCKEKTAVPYFIHLYNAARKITGEDYYLPSNEMGSYDQEEMFIDKQQSKDISPEDIYNGFEFLSVNERCNARRVLNDVLSECIAWKLMCKEMKQRGWFKEPIYQAGDTIIKGDYIAGDKVGEKSTISNVGNFKPEIDTQTLNVPLSGLALQNTKQLEDE